MSEVKFEDFKKAFEEQWEATHDSFSMNELFEYSNWLPISSIESKVDMEIDEMLETAEAMGLPQEGLQEIHQQWLSNRDLRKAFVDDIRDRVVAISLSVNELICVENIKAYEDEGFDVRNKPDLLVYAAGQKDGDAVEYLLDKGISPNHSNDLGHTPLIFAASAGNLEYVQVLLDRGADVNAKNSLMETALNLSIANEYENIALLLIEKGADVNAKDMDGMTPLHYSATKGYSEVTDALLGKGADPRIADNEGFKPAEYARVKNFGDIAGSLEAKGQELDLRDKHGVSMDSPRPRRNREMSL